MQLCFNNIHEAIDGISTLISEGDTDFLLLKKRIQERDVLSGKKSDHSALHKAKSERKQLCLLISHHTLTYLVYWSSVGGNVSQLQFFTVEAML